MTTPGSATTTAPPHLHLTDFLTDDEHERLIDLARRHQSELVASAVLTPNVGGGVDHDVRRSLSGMATTEMFEPFEERLHALLPHLRKEVDVPWFPLSGIESQFTAHGDGDFFATHTDDGSVATRSRKVTFVYYFHLPPKGFQGGELVLFDWLDEDGWRLPGEVSKVIEPEDNSIIFFPSNAYHEVKPVRSSSNDPRDYRLTVNGWFHAATTTADVEALDHLTNAQRVVVPKFTETGFHVGTTPKGLHQRLHAAWQRGHEQESVVLGDDRLYPAGLPHRSPVDLDTTGLLAETQTDHEAWLGTELEPIAVDGFRTFRTGQTQRPHTLRVESNVVSTLFCIDVDGDGMAPWPLYIVDHRGTEHEIDLDTGQYIRWESASCPLGFNAPLEANSATHLLVHHRPAGWDWTEHRVWKALADRDESIGSTESEV